MRNLIMVFAALSLFSTTALAKEYSVDPAHSNVSFNIRHLVSKVSGSFTDFESNFTFDEKNPEKSAGKFVVKTSSVNTANQKRDDHLKSADFFNVEKFPTMSYESTKVSKKGKGKFQIDGNFTLLGTSKPISFKMEYMGTVKDPWGNMKAGYSATGKINRKDFGMTWNKALDVGGVMLGDDVEISLQIEATEKVTEKVTGQAAEKTTK